MSKPNLPRESNTSLKKRRGSRSPEVSSKTSKEINLHEQSAKAAHVKVMSAAESGSFHQPQKKIRRSNLERMQHLARPTPRRLRSLWDEKCAILPPDRRDKIKSALEEDYFLSPEQTEQYFQNVSGAKPWSTPGDTSGRRDAPDRARELQQRQKWLIDFSAQVAYNLCNYISKGQKELLVTNRLRSIADVVLERVAEILGEPKPSRTNPGRLARFMVAISDRIAVWIENAVYRADAIEPSETSYDEHIRLDDEKMFV